MSDVGTPEARGDQASRLSGDDVQDRIVAALGHLRGVRPRSGDSYRETDSPSQKARLQEWAKSLGCLLNPEEILPRLRQGGHEHDYFLDETQDRCFKLTRSGVFGLIPGIDLALVPADQDARRFHLWEASPLEYLERLRLQNLITPGLNRLEGVLAQENDLAICISQPRLDLIAVTQAEIDAWFFAQGFQIVTTAAYYRAKDNLGIFDAHDKNVVRSSVDPAVLIPFDVIPVQPEGSFLDFIRDTLTRGEFLTVVRTTHTTTRALT